MLHGALVGGHGPVRDRLRRANSKVQALTRFSHIDDYAFLQLDEAVKEATQGVDMNKYGNEPTNDEITHWLEARHPSSWLYGINMAAALAELMQLRNDLDELRSMLFEAARTENALTKRLSELQSDYPAK